MTQPTDPGVSPDQMLALVMTGVEQSAEAFALADVRGSIEYANPAHALALGRPWFDILGLPLWAALVPGDAARVAEAVRNGLSFSDDVTLKSGDGSHRVHHMVITPLKTDAANPRFVVLQRDLTEQFERDLALDQLRSELAGAERTVAVAQLAAGFAHEVTNPAAYLLTNLELAMEELTAMAADRGGVPTAEGLSQVVHMVSDALVGARRVASLARDAVALAARDLPPLVGVNLADVAREAIAVIRPQTSLRARVVAELAAEPMARADRLRLGQAAVHLLSAATRSLPTGLAHEHEIVVRTECRDASADLLVLHDDAQLHSAAAEWFSTPPCTNTKGGRMSEGSEHAMCSARDLVLDLGGELSASREGGHSLFRVRMPLWTGRNL